MVKHRETVKTLTADAFRDANARWLKAMEATLQKLHDDETLLPNVGVTWYPSNAIDLMYEEVSSAQAGVIALGYGCMLAFVIATQFSCTRRANLMLLGLLGFLCVCVANLAAYGLIALAGYKFNHAMLHALPFIALGLGVDDLFLLLHAFRTTMLEYEGGRAELLVALSMMEAGSSVTITSLCNAGVFFVACVIPIPAIRALLVGAGCVVLLNWLCTMTLLPMLLSLWAKCFEDPAQAAKGADEVLAQIEKVEAERLQKAGGTLLGKFYGYFARSLPLKLAFLLVGLTSCLPLACLLSAS